MKTNFRRLLLSILWIVLFAGLSHAEGPRIGAIGNIGVSHPESNLGLGAGLGGTVKWSRFFGTGLADFTFVPKPPLDRYVVGTYSSGTECQDIHTGRFVDAENCRYGDHVLVGGMFDANLLTAPNLPLTVGAGYRVGVGRGPYATFGLAGFLHDPHPRIDEKTIGFLRISIGKNFLQAHVGLAVWPRR